MTLARIITHSDLCARELAFHLLGRGYAVEIVSPDSIPDNFADLELRVDADSGDQLVASLAAYEGQRSSAIDFVARVKVPMDEGVFRPVVGETTRVLSNPVLSDVIPIVSYRTVGDREASADSPDPTSWPVSLLAEDALDPEARSDLSLDLCSETAAHLPPAGEVLPSSTSDMPQLEPLPEQPGSSAVIPIEITDEPLSYFARQTSLIAMPFAGPAVVLPTWEQQTPDRPIEWKSIAPAALTLTAVVLLSLFLAFGVRASAKPSTASSTPTRTAAASANAPSPVSEKVATSEKPRAGLQVASRPKLSSTRVADVIAPDTVTYLDGRYKPASKAKPLHAKPSSNRSSRANAAPDTTIYFSSATSPQPAK